MKSNHMGTGLELRQVFVLHVMLMMAVGGIARAQGTQTYESEAFGVGNWSLQGAYSSPVAGATGSFEARSGDGNPDDYARIVVQMPSNPECPIGAYAVALNSSAVYDPAVLGPIQSIDYSWDMRISPDEPEFTVGSLALIQNGFLYAAFDARLNTGAPPSPWQNYAINGLTEADFGSYGGWNQAGQPARPDFSESGAPITFGHVVGTSRGFGSFDGLCANPPPAGSDLDNWEVVVTTAPLSGAGTLRFEIESYSAAESSGSVAAVVQRTGGSDDEVSVEFRTVAETATADADFTSAQGTLIFGDGVSEELIEVELIDDNQLEGPETFRIELSNPMAGATLGTPAVTTITIGDDEEGYDVALGLQVIPIYTEIGGGFLTEIELRVIAYNDGPGPATSLVATIYPFPESAGEYEYQSDNSGGLFQQNVIAQWIWQVGDLAAGETKRMAARFSKVEAQVGAELTLQGVLRSTTPDPEPDLDNNEAIVTVPVGGADLGVQLNASTVSVTNAGAVFSDALYELVLSNLAPAGEAAVDVVVSVDLPGSYASSDPEIPGCEPVDGGTRFQCTFAELAEAITTSIRVSVPGPATATATAEVTSGNFDPDPDNNSASATVEIPDPFISTQEIPTLGDLTGSSGPCFIATAAWGSAWEPNVVLLREFRDSWLVTNAPGRWFVATYYRLSPPIADWIREREWARAMTRWALTPLVTAIRHPVGTAALLFLGIALVIGRRRRRAGKETFRTFVPFFPDRPSS